jgi:Ca2+-binding RTX toxin-like protein
VSNLNAPAAGGTVRGTNAADVITGSANADVLWGLGGADVINGGDGNDVIEGDGAATLSEAISSLGTYFVPFPTNSSSQPKPSLKFLGNTADNSTVWQIRNNSDTAITVTVEAIRDYKLATGRVPFGPVTYVIPAHTDLILASPSSKTHDISVGGVHIADADPRSNQTFISDIIVTGASVVDGNDILSGGNGNDTIRGWGGNDKLYGDAGNDTLDGGNGNDTLVGGSGADTLIGGDGVDTADYSTSTASVNVNLETGIGKGGDAEGDVLSGIENLIGSKYNDVLVGNASVNLIDGGDGDDTITGGSNNDKLFGGAGNDTFLVEWSFTGDSYDGGSGIDTFSADVATLDAYAQEIDLVTGTNNWQDHFTNIENLIGGAANDKFWGTDGENSFWGRGGNDLLDGRGGDDKLYGEAGNDVLFGGNGNDLLDGGIGNDLLSGGAGADVLDGGLGVDTADYSASAGGVTVNLTSGIGIGADAEGDKLTGIENLNGSKFDDILTGNSGANIILAGEGNDKLVGSGGGDVMNGGDGVDTADYSNSTSGVTVNLLSGLGAGGFASGDTLISIENVAGSKYDDVITGDAGANILRSGLGNDKLVGSGGGDVMDGGDGVDTADYSNSTSGVTVNLVSGLGSGGFAAGDSLLSIENVTGSKFDDVLLGISGSNVLDGGLGNDVLVGGAGADTLIGGAGVDLVDYSTSSAGVTVNLATGLGLGGDAEGDKLSGIENLVGSKYADILIGDAASNSIYGGDGNDHIYGSGGGDKIDGGNGVDWVDYRNSTAGVYVNLATAVGHGGFAEGDTYVSIEDIRGSKFGDTLIGDDKANVIYAGSGQDHIEGGGGNDMIYSGGGYDSIDGGTGIDTLSYADSWASVVVNLATGVGQYGAASQDTITGIENLVGSKFNDKMTGDAGDNKLNGAAGNDELHGGAGNDMLIGGTGGDILDGGVGQDTANYAAALEAVIVNLATGGTGGEAAGDSYISIEQVLGSAFNDTITGSAADERISGGAGNDTINGAGGIDYIYGDVGNDILTGGSGADVFVFGTGFGADKITDFWSGLGRTDRVQLLGTDLHSYADVLSHAVETANGVVLSVNGGLDTITFTGLHLNQFNADDFLFA